MASMVRACISSRIPKTVAMYTLRYFLFLSGRAAGLGWVDASLLLDLLVFLFVFFGFISGQDACSSDFTPDMYVCMYCMHICMYVLCILYEYICMNIYIYCTCIVCIYMYSYMDCMYVLYESIYVWMNCYIYVCLYIFLYIASTRCMFIC